MQMLTGIGLPKIGITWSIPEQSLHLWIRNSRGDGFAGHDVHVEPEFVPRRRQPYGDARGLAGGHWRALERGGKGAADGVAQRDNGGEADRVRRLGRADVSRGLAERSGLRLLRRLHASSLDFLKLNLSRLADVRAVRDRVGAEHRGGAGHGLRGEGGQRDGASGHAAKRVLCFSECALRRFQSYEVGVVWVFLKGADGERLGLDVEQVCMSAAVASRASRQGEVSI